MQNGVSLKKYYLVPYNQLWLRSWYTQRFLPFPKTLQFQNHLHVQPYPHQLGCYSVSSRNESQVLKIHSVDNSEHLPHLSLCAVIAKCPRNGQQNTAISQGFRCTCIQAPKP